MKYEGKEVEFLVEPFSDSYYVINYRIKRRFNLFGFWFWKRYEYVWKLDTTTFDKHQPYLYSSFDQARRSAEELKKNPKLIDEHIEAQKMRWKQCIDEYNKHYANRTKSTII
jgi:hypothetical protein